MRDLRSRLTISAVAVILGLLVVVQLRGQAGGTRLQSLSAQDLTQLVANLNEGNDELRTEVASLQRELDALTANQTRGDASVDEIRLDLARIRGYAGLDGLVGPGVSVSVSGPIAGADVEELLNVLRNAGAEAIAVDGVRLVPGVVVIGAPGALTIDGRALGTPFDIDAIGASEGLTGSLTRSGGIIAQFAATEPDVVLTVTPMDRLVLPASTRTLVPGNGHPTL